MKNKQLHAIETELRKVTGLAPEAKEARQRFLARLIRAAHKLDEKVWGTVSTPAQTWVNEGIAALNRKVEVPEFDAAPVKGKKAEVEELDEAEASDEDEDEDEEESEEEESDDDEDDEADASDEDEEESEEEESDEDDDEAEASDEDEDEEEEAPAPKAKKAKKAAKAEEQDDSEESTEDDESEEDQPEEEGDEVKKSKKAPKAEKSEKKAKKAPSNGRGDKVARFRKLVINNPDAKLEKVMEKAGAAGIDVSKATGLAVFYQTRATLDVLRDMGKL